MIVLLSFMINGLICYLIGMFFKMAIGSIILMFIIAPGLSWGEGYLISLSSRSGFSWETVWKFFQGGLLAVCVVSIGIVIANI